MESFQQYTSTLQYADLQPLRILDEVVVNDSKDHNCENNVNEYIEGPALTPIKEELVSKDLSSYFLGKDKLFDEPDSLPIIWLQLPRRDNFLTNKKKHSKPTAQSSGKKHHQCRPNKLKKKLERNVPCPNCDRKFITVGHMKIHVRIHAMRKRKKSCCCVCGRKFTHGGALCLHMRTHKLIARARE